MPKKSLTTINTSSSTNSSSASDQDGTHFETALNELESLISKMESGQLSLQESLESFESGIALSRACQEALKKAEQKVEILVNKNSKDNNNIQTEAFVVLEE